MSWKKNRWTIAVVAVWVIALALSTVLAPAPAEARAQSGGMWMAYTPHHPEGCSPLPFDCYVIVVRPND